MNGFFSSKIPTDEQHVKEESEKEEEKKVLCVFRSEIETSFGISRLNDDDERMCYQSEETHQTRFAK